ncbi:ricin-type beta-trefoil lectin domain protein [Zooshikella harenae]|uniref:Ricin-type beta-trefoil lectin domain protein n=1 Tax=Zooshikella harenae TaxID=2827238 RepID=A0ABS5ZAL6_9GAMM|nr:ricin-type beta-trefoil lectin domain protein [Zooshikella harenae]MBU2711111.1 ricin-type beta-trefoil lectin domain protein [Zooshikella harenae]
MYKKENKLRLSFYSIYTLLVLLITHTVAAEARNYFQIESNNGYCLDVKGNGTGNLTPVIAYNCHGRDNQLWFSDRRGRIHSKSAPHMCLEAGNPRQGNTAFIYTCNKEKHQRWYWRGPYLHNRRNSDFVLDHFVSRGQVGVWQFHGRSNQKWRMIRQQVNDGYPYSFPEDRYPPQKRFQPRYSCYNYDINAGPIWDNQDAQYKCPRVCQQQRGKWTGHWRTTQWGQASVCSCKICD